MISSIYPFSSDIRSDAQAFTYIVPLNYVGTTLVCAASGWPVPEIEWLKDGLPVPINNGVVSQSVAMSTTISARLSWTRYFLSSDAGRYECVVRKPNTVVPITSQTVYLKAENLTLTQPSMPCSVEDQLIYFQIRVLGTGCVGWDSEQSALIATEFHDELLDVLRTQCNCQVTETELEVLGLPQCSTKVNGAAVFRGRIQTSSQGKPEQLFCSLSSWQQKSPLIRINSQFQAVDTTCPIESSGSLNGEECVSPTPTIGLTEKAAIGGAVAVIVIVLLIAVLLICCTFRYYHERNKRIGVPARMDSHNYSR